MIIFRRNNPSAINTDVMFRAPINTITSPVWGTRNPPSTTSYTSDLLERSNLQLNMSQQQPSTQNAADANAASKWGITPNSSTTSKPLDPSTGKPIDWENFYDEETKKELRAKGVNPALKAEMEWHKNQSEGKGIWGKVAQTAMGGGWIK